MGMYERGREAMILSMFMFPKRRFLLVKHLLPIGFPLKLDYQKRIHL
jgi:hypothetical protein